MFYLDGANLPGLWRILVGSGISLVMGWVLCRFRPRTDRGSQILLFLTPVSLYLLVVKSAMHALFAPQMDWSSGRLAPTISLFHGYSLYYGVDSGPIFNTIYPPMTYLSFLPAALFQGPTTSLIAAVVLSQIMVLGPILGLVWAPHGQEGQTRSPLLGFFVFLGFWKVIASTILNSTLTLVHADAPALGFATLAVSFLYSRRFEATPSNRTLLSAAVFASLAVWSKQIYAPLFVVLPLWLWMSSGMGAGLRAVGWFSATLGLFSTIFCSAFGYQSIVFNVLTLPKSHPWLYGPRYSEGFQVFGLEHAVILFTSLFLILVMVAFYRDPAGSTNEFSSIRSRLRSNYWLLFVVIAVALSPFALLARIKVGGHLNSYAHTLYFLSVAPCVLFLDWHAQNQERGREGWNLGLKAALLVSPFCPLMVVNADLLLQYNTLPPTLQNAQEVAYQYGRKHPGEAYFPWNPLSTLMSEGRADHFEPGIFDRELGNFTPTETHYRRHLPPKLRLVAYPPGRPMEWSMKYLPEFNQRVVDPELPGWICYQRP